MTNNENKLISGYNISASFEVISFQYGITPEIQEKLTEMSVKVQKKKNSAIKELNDLIKKHPSIPQFKSLLSILYDKQGNQFMSNEVNRRLVSLHPKYLHGKLHLANIAIANAEYEKVPEILGKAMDLKALYPDRNVFHYSEVLGFYQTTFLYFIGIENIEEARTRLDIIEKTDREFDLKTELFDFRRHLMLLSLDKSLKQDEEEEMDSFNVEPIPVKVVEATTEAPVFENELIQELYHNDLNIDPEIIHQILLLPRESLIADLHKMLYDSIARHTVFTDELEWSSKTHEFFIHALSLLADLKDYSSLEVIFDILRQDVNYIETWLSDYLTDEFIEIVYHLGSNKLEKLRSFVFEPDRYLYSRTMISGVLQQIALHEPERRAEVIDWYESVIDEILKREEDETIIDSEWIAFLVCDLVDLQARELTAQITELFNHGLVFKGISGSLKDCLTDILMDSKIDRKKPKFENTIDRYNHYLHTWYYYKDATDDIASLTKVDEKISYEEDDEVEIIPSPVEKLKVGRNDPCPCGSGKKYKKCCLKV